MKALITIALFATVAFGQPPAGAGKGKGKGGPPADAVPVPSIPCDRACLLQTVDTYLAALVAHDPSKAPFAPMAKSVENAVAIKPGEGLWMTASALPTTFKIYVPDAVSEEVAFMGVMQESGKPIQLGLRLRIVNKQITQAEHLIARNLSANQLDNLQTPRPALLATVPQNERSPRENMLNDGMAYYDALDDNRGSLAPFADDCVRRENGMQTNANPTPGQGALGVVGTMKCAAQIDTNYFQYITLIDNRRVEIADPDTGLVVGFSQFRHAMKDKSFKIFNVPGVTTREMTNMPFDLPAMHIFKIRGGKIHEIEAMGFSIAYNSNTGWE
jgi:hypothetical protein